MFALSPGKSVAAGLDNLSGDKVIEYVGSTLTGITNANFELFWIPSFISTIQSISWTKVPSGIDKLNQTSVTVLALMTLLTT